MQSALIQVEDRDGVRVLRLDRPPMNALDLELARAAQRAIAEAGAGILLPAGPLTVARAELAAGPESEAFAGIVDRDEEPLLAQWT